MSIFNIFKKKQKKNHNVQKEQNETTPIFPTITLSELNRPVKPKLSSVEQFWLNHINRIKSDENLKMLFPDIIEKMEEDLTQEEMKELIKPIEEYERIENYKVDVIFHLAYEYNKAIERKVEENYKTGKIEEFPLCKRLTLVEYNNLKAMYEEDIKYLGELYLPTYKEYMDNYLFTNESNFTDITEFVNFIDKIKFYEGSMISDKQFNVVNRALAYYGKEFYGNITGIVKEYSFKYDNYLEIKDNIMGEIEILMNENCDDEEKRDAVITIKAKGRVGLSVKEAEYMV